MDQSGTNLSNTATSSTHQVRFLFPQSVFEIPNVVAAPAELPAYGDLLRARIRELADLLVATRIEHLRSVQSDDPDGEGRDLRSDRDWRGAISKPSGRSRYAYIQVITPLIGGPNEEDDNDFGSDNNNEVTPLTMEEVRAFIRDIVDPMSARDTVKPKAQRQATAPLHHLINQTIKNGRGACR